jgi:glycosyltransferase involved in cell wall biosynthesis
MSKDNSNKLKIMVIIAHKDYNDYLDNAIESCKKQTIPVNFTVIDDCSKTPPNPPDWPLIKEDEFYKVYSQDGNFYIYLNQSVGPSEARNIGIKESWDNISYFQILDADDEMLPQKCETLLKNFDNNTGVVYADYFIESNGIRKMEFKIPYSKQELFQHCIVHSGSMVSKKALSSVYENNSFYDPTLRTCEDYDLWLRISDKFTIKHVPEFLTIVKEHSFNATNSVPSETWQSNIRRVKQKVLERKYA